MPDSNAPTFALQIAFATNPTAVPTYVNVGTRVIGFRSRRGRANELDRYQAGQLMVSLENDDRALDPENTASPYYPNVRPMRKLQLVMTYDGVVYPVFTGFAESWPQQTIEGIVQIVPLEAIDGFGPLALTRLSWSYPVQRGDMRVTAILNDAAWPAADRLIGMSSTVMQAVTLQGQDALTHLFDVEMAENGHVFVRADGRVAWQGRHQRLRPPMTSVLATFSDAHGSDLPYADLVYEYDAAWIRNTIRTSVIGGPVHTRIDVTSQARYFPRGLDRTDLHGEDSNEALDAAEWLLARYKEPRLRVTQLVIEPQTEPGLLFPQVLGREIGDRIRVKRTPLGGGPIIDQEVLIEGIRHEWGAGRVWRTTWQLSLADPELSVWLLGDAIYSVLGTTTRMVY